MPCSRAVKSILLLVCETALETIEASLLPVIFVLVTSFKSKEETEGKKHGVYAF